MRVGFFRRLTSYLIDTMPIILILSLMLTLFVGDLLKSEFDDFDSKFATYQANQEEYYDTLEAWGTQLENDEITTDEFETMSLDLREEFNTDNQELTAMILAYYVNVFLYFFVSYSIVYYFYVLIMKGQTFGRKLMKIELYGKINWFTLLLREFLWKSVFWMFTLTAGFAIDAGLIAFTRKKKTIRDYLSETEIRFSGINYPF